MVALLQADADGYTWVAATIGSNNASGYQLATGEPVMAIGGFNGTDPSPTLAQFQQYVAEGKIHYFIGGGIGGGTPTGGSAAAQEIAELGRAELHRHDRRRGHRLRPDRLSPPSAGRSTVDRPASACSARPGTMLEGTPGHPGAGGGRSLSAPT